MVQLTGFISIMLIAGLPVLVQQSLPLAAAGLAAGAISAIALLLPSLGLVVTGAIGALLVFSVALLMAPSAHPIAAAILLGIALLTLLDLTYYRQRFRSAMIEPAVAHAHLANLALSVLVSVGAIVFLGGFVEIFSISLDATTRPIVATFGGILVMAALLQTATRRPGHRSRAGFRT
jgi:hypothetical protein